MYAIIPATSEPHTIVLLNRVNPTNGISKSFAKVGTKGS